MASHPCRSAGSGHECQFGPGLAGTVLKKTPLTSAWAPAVLVTLTRTFPLNRQTVYTPLRNPSRVCVASSVLVAAS